MTPSISPQPAIEYHHGDEAHARGLGWRHWEGYLLQLNANLSITPTEHFEVAAGRELWLEGRYSTHGVFEPWTVQWQAIDE